MNNKTIIWVIVTILVIGGIVGYLLFFNKSKTGTQVPASIMGNNQQQAATEPSSLKDLLASGSPQKCTFADTSGTNSSEGTVYIGNGKMRQDFSTVDNGQTINGHMIADEQNFYTWTDGSNVGFKMAITASQQTNQNSQSVDVNKKFDFKCGTWSPDSSLFILPSDVQFNDISSMMPQIPQGQTQTQPEASATPGEGSGSQDNKSAQCSACDSAPEASRAACRQALGCQ